LDGQGGWEWEKQGVNRGGGFQNKGKIESPRVKKNARFQKGQLSVVALFQRQRTRKGARWYNPKKHKK